MLGSATLPLSTAYAASEAFGTELGLDRRVKQAPFFYGIYTAALIVAALFVLLPGIPLIGILFLSQMVNGILLPIILVFVLVIINDKGIMGKYTNGFVFNAVTGITVVALIVVSLLLIPVTLMQQFGGG